MPIPVSKSLLMIFLMAGITYLIRLLPFLLFPGGRKTPGFILYLGKVLPYAMIGLLVIYCFKSTPVLSAPYGIPELLAVLFIVMLHVWKRNTLLSIASGSLLYMFLVQFIF